MLEGEPESCGPIAAARLQKGGQQFRDDAFAAAVILDEALAERSSILRAQRVQDFRCFGFRSIEKDRLEALHRLKPLHERLQRREMFGVPRRAGERQEQGILALGDSGGGGGSLFCERPAAMLHHGQQQQVQVPLIEVAQQRLGHHRHSEALMPRGLEEPLAR